MAAYIRPEFTRGTLSGGGGPERIHLADVGPGFFELLGTAPLIGRTFEPGDFSATRAPSSSATVSGGSVSARIAACSARSIQLGDATVEIVGVMPPEFELPERGGPALAAAVVRPGLAERTEPRLRTASSCSAGWRRRRPSRRRAPKWMPLRPVCESSIPRSNASFGVSTDPLVDRVIGPTTERSLWLLFGSVGFVLLIACANVANLVLARAAARRHEFSLRTALGAGKTRLVRQALTENLVLSLLAGTVGLLFAWAGTMALRDFAAGALPRADSIQLDASVLLFLLVASLGSGLLAGLLPALAAVDDESRRGPPRGRPADARRTRRPPRAPGAGGRRDRARRDPAVGRRSPDSQLPARPGGEPRVRLAQRAAAAGGPARQRTTTTAKSAAFFSEATRRIRALPGVVAVGAISDFFIHRQPDYRIALEGQPPQRPDDPAPPLTEDQVVPGYFEAMRIPLLRGRLLQDSDLAPGRRQVVVINEEMARRFWPGQDAVGRRFKYGLDPAAKSPWKTVVGVVADMRRQRLDEAAIPYMFQPGVRSQMDIAVRTLGDPDVLREAIRAEMRALDPAAPPYGIVTVEQRLGRTVALRRLQTMLLVALAASR